MLAKLDSSISRLRYAAFQLLLYYPRTHITILVTDLTRLNDQELDDFKAEEDVERDKEDKEEGSSN